MLKENRINVIVPCYNAEENLDVLASSLLEQKYNNWKAWFIDDMSTNDTAKKLLSLQDANKDRFDIQLNTEKKWALRNIIETCDRIDASRANMKEAEIITIVDGDDSLCNAETFNLLNSAFVEGAKFAYTMNRWDLDGRNTSDELPIGIDPYSWRWCTSHLRAFDLDLLMQINRDNFKDVYGVWFQRCYDQSMTLPALVIANDRIKFIKEVCYCYNMNSCSIVQNRNDGGKQLHNLKFIRARGYVK